MNKTAVAERATSTRFAFLVRQRDVPIETAQAIARLIGPVFCAMGIGMLVSADSYHQLAAQILTGYTFIYYSGVLILLAGLLILNAHHVWTRDWRVSITLLGWIFACVGSFRLIAPQFVSQIGGAMIMSGAFFMCAGAVFLSLGAFLTFKGYAA
ncbi:MAG TPA: hypothetical protein VFL51_15515 [Pseudolabrys sp.]|nr:hypothetical protein [Pseudolabrys sp.]